MRGPRRNGLALLTMVAALSGAGYRVELPPIGAQKEKELTKFDLEALDAAKRKRERKRNGRV